MWGILALTITGKILFQDFDCVRCSHKIRLYNFDPTNIKCGDCGAVYILIDQKVQDGYKTVNFGYDFYGFKCIYSGIDACENLCPSPFMYCKEHCSDQSLERIKDDISFNMDKIKNLKNKLELMEESKKNWLISEVAGLDE